MLPNEPPLGRVKVAPLGVDEVEHVKMGDWVIGCGLSERTFDWVRATQPGATRRGHRLVHLDAAPRWGAALTLRSPNVSSAMPQVATRWTTLPTPAAEFPPGWSLEGAAEVSEDLRTCSAILCPLSSFSISSILIRRSAYTR
jgi:hypothetical protein